MNLTVHQMQNQVPVTVLQVEGDVDGSTYKALIDKAQELFRAGTRDLVLDLSAVRYLSSAGLVALHQIALLMRGEQPPDLEQGWSAMHAVAADASGIQQHVKLLNLQARVDKTLEMAGMKEFFEIHTELNTAVSSFSAG
jgi:anti-anti-sigma regulatory factor